MIEFLFAKLMQVNNRLKKIRDAASNNLFGDGMLGNVYIGKTEQLTEEIMHDYKTDFVNETGVCTFPVIGTTNFKNLYIDTGSRLLFPGGITTIKVQETLTLKGMISVANTIPGACMKSSNCPSIRSIIELWSDQNVLTETEFFLTGGTGQTEIFKETPSGGCVGVYYCNIYDLDGLNLGTNFNNCVVINGADSGNSGGSLMIAANKIILGPTAYLTAAGGDGSNSSVAKKGLFLNHRLKSIDFEN